jgi:hypothetical protein
MQSNPATFMTKMKKAFTCTHVNGLSFFAPRGHTEDMEVVLKSYRSCTEKGRLFGERLNVLGMETSRDCKTRTIEKGPLFYG